jgi:hypothetical protein
MFFGKKYYPLPQISPPIALTRKCFNRVHPKHVIELKYRAKMQIVTFHSKVPGDLFDINYFINIIILMNLEYFEFYEFIISVGVRYQ